ncbi:GNAT family N-acetyltransferase [Streptomyces sp. NBC_00726]|uniref:GNAT family N-acetyltransferase n=1 Tax=Streptomyces sp. NBC_00726 TaxID=2903674 RepID=UPI00386CE026
MTDIAVRPPGTWQEHTSSAGPADERWEALLSGDDFHLSRRWLELAERTTAAPIRYLTRHRGEELEGALVTVVGDRDAPWVLARPDTLLAACAAEGREGAAGLLAETGDPAALLPSLVCGGRHMGRSRLLLRDGAPDDTADGLLDRAERHARSVGAASVAFPFVDERDTALRELLERRGYRRHASGRYARLPLPAGGLDGYLAALPGKRRRRAQADRRQLSAAGITSSLAPLDRADIPRLAVLEAELMAKYGLDWAPANTEAALHGIADLMGEDALVSRVTGDGEIRGYAVLLRHRDQWYSRQTGFDYAYQGRLPLYFEALYYRPALEAPAHGVTGIHYGLGSEEAKRSRGCLADTQFAYLLRLEES